MPFLITFANLTRSVRIDWAALLCGLLATCLAFKTLSTWQRSTQVVKAAALTDAQHARVAPHLDDLVYAATKRHVSQLAAKDPPFISTSEVFGASLAASSPYFHALTRLYGTPGTNEETLSDEPAPKDEVATFHSLDAGLPLKLARITSPFGERSNPFGHGRVFHRGIDMAAPIGTPIYAVAEGKVITAGHDAMYGNYVVIDHQNGYRSLYAHTSKLLVKAGERVAIGQLIAKVGSTGHSTGPHLHFEIHRYGKRVDPYPYLAANMEGNKSRG